MGEVEGRAAGVRVARRPKVQKMLRQLVPVLRSGIELLEMYVARMEAKAKEKKGERNE